MCEYISVLHSGECERFPAVGDFQEGQRPLSFNWSVRERGRFVPAHRGVYTTATAGPPGSTIVSSRLSQVMSFPSVSRWVMWYRRCLRDVKEGTRLHRLWTDRSPCRWNSYRCTSSANSSWSLVPQTHSPYLPVSSFAGFFDLQSDHKSTLIVFSELPQKPLKRRRSFIAWAFWRGSSSHLNDPSLSITRGCLFSQPLSAVCIDGALPKPVMVSWCVSKSTNKKMEFKFTWKPFFSFPATKWL